MFRKVKLNVLFETKSGDYHAIKELENGNIPLISCGEGDNGFVGYYDIPNDKRYSNTITVAYNGSWPLTANYHNYEFGTKDDVAVLIPHRPLEQRTLIYIAALLNSQKWRYSYGRKCFQNKINDIEILLPFNEENVLDEELIDSMFNANVNDYVPDSRAITDNTAFLNIHWGVFALNDLFDIKSGDYHKLDGLDPGETALVSCAEANNGLVGHYNISPENIYEKRLTATFDGNRPVTIKYHDYQFAAYDNVGVMIPHQELRTTTLFFIASAITMQRWRYSYGRKCYLTKFSKIKIKVPINADNSLNEDLMEEIVKSTPYSAFIVSKYPNVRSINS